MIVAHDNVRTRMLASPADIQRDYPARLEEAKKAGNEDDGEVPVRPDRVGEDGQGRGHPGAGDDVRLGAARSTCGDETIHVWHLPPAHTDGDSVVYFEKAKVLHMGDDFFNEVIPFIDV